MPQLSMTPVLGIIGTSPALVATVPANIEWNANLRVANLTNAAVTLTIYIMPDASPLGTSNQVQAAYVIPANDARYPLEGIQLPPGWRIHLGASAANALQFMLHGTQKSTSE